MLDEKLIGAVAQFAWPLVALIALFTLRPYISMLTKGVADLRAVIERSGELTDLLKSLAEIQETVNDLQAAQETALIVRSTAIKPSAISATNAKALWQVIDEQWEQTKNALRNVAEDRAVPTAQVRAIGQGTGPLQRVTDALTVAGAIKSEVADKIVGLSKRWHWMRRTTLPQEQYLDEAVVENFKSDAISIREQLPKIA
jgi:hypothetical protein